MISSNPDVCQDPGRDNLPRHGLDRRRSLALLLSPGALLQATQVPPALRGQVQQYLAILAFGLPPALLFRI